LAERLGKTVGELGEQLSAEEFVEWCVFDRLEAKDRKTPKD